ncbi:hypothetical protein VP01_1161g4 [Puccinia sorghi]|uniref:Uncharacterized protein n=1 Tax=Puccinia sorghi TaxID=27349 RepID=A0A0L6VRI6_9BASI|nr:hypothetical protein VP01_1161g4 [Puccinia sorghi]
MDHRQAIAINFQRPALQEKLTQLPEAVEWVFLSVYFSLWRNLYHLFPQPQLSKTKKSKLDPIHLMHVNGNHWVLVLLKATNRSNPIPLIIGSTKFASHITHSWRSGLKDKF